MCIVHHHLKYRLQDCVSFTGALYRCWNWCLSIACPFQLWTLHFHSSLFMHGQPNYVIQVLIQAYFKLHHLHCQTSSFFVKVLFILLTNGYYVSESDLLWLWEMSLKFIKVQMSQLFDETSSFAYLFALEGNQPL